MRAGHKERASKGEPSYAKSLEQCCPELLDVLQKRLVERVRETMHAWSGGCFVDVIYALSYCSLRKFMLFAVLPR